MTLRDRQSDNLVRHVDALREAFRHTQSVRSFAMPCVVILPDHLHAIWHLPDGDADFGGRWRIIKSHFVQALTQDGVVIERNTSGEAICWQRRFWEHTIRNEADFQAHADYIHFNPVKHGLCMRPIGWPYSSLHQFVARGELSAHWTCTPNDTLQPGE